MSVIVRDRGKRGLLMWYKVNMPKVYAQLIRKLPAEGGIAGMGAIDPATVATQTAPTRSWVDSFSDALKSVAQGYATIQQVKAQEKIANVQLQRAINNQPPLNINPVDYGLTPQVAVGVTGDTKKFATYAVVGLGALYLLSQFVKRR